MVWDIHPTLIHLGPGLPQIRYYGLAVALGWALAILATAHYGERSGIRHERITGLLAWAAVAAFVGGHLGHIAFYEPESLADPMRLVALGSGQASHGALIGIVSVLWLYARRHGEPAGRYLDAAASGLVFALPCSAWAT